MNQTYRFRRAQMYFDTRDYNHSESTLNQLVEEQEHFADAWHLLGLIAYHRGNLKQATSHFKRALSINSGYVEAALNLIVCCNDQGQHEEASKLYEEMTQKVSSEAVDAGDLVGQGVKSLLANQYGEVGDLLVRSGYPERAVKEYRRALRKCGQFMDIRLKLISGLIAAGNFKGAQLESKRILDVQPNRLEALHLQGLAFFMSGDEDQAKSIWDKALVLDPNHELSRLYVDLCSKV
jgi:protein O-GlcNAc transferase